MDDFWIGDLVKVISTGVSGQYEGMEKNKAKVKVNNKIIFIDPENIELIPEEELEMEISILSTLNDQDQKTTFSFKTEIDLHIEVLEPKMKNQKAEVILHFQLKKLKEFIETAISRRMYKVLVIHGKGLGRLKMEVEHTLQNYSQVDRYNSVNEGGAMEVFFSY